MEATRVLVVGNGVSTAYPDGSVQLCRHTVKFLRELSENGLSVRYAEPIATSAHLDNRVALQSKCEFPHAEIGGTFIDRRGTWLTLLGVTRLLRDVIRSDFVYCFMPGTWPTLVTFMCWVCGKPFALYLRGQNFSLSGIKWRLCRQAKFALTVADSFSRQLSAKGMVSKTIRPMIDFDFQDIFVKSPSESVTHCLKLIYVGRIEQDKGVFELLDAMVSLASMQLNVELVIVGDGSEYHRVAQIVKENRMGHVRLLGPVHDKAELLRIYRAADVLVLPSYHEGFPRVLYEAMLNSVAIVTTMVGAIPDVMLDGRNCLSITVGSSEDIMRAVVRLMRSPPEMSLLVEKGLGTVREVLQRRPSHSVAFCESMRESLDIKHCDV